MFRSDGITPKGTDTYRNKYIIVVGSDEKKLYGVVAANTRDHRLVPIEFQYPLNHQGYHCFVNCYQLHQVSSERLTLDCFQGNVSDEDLELIIECVKNSPAIPVKLLKKFQLTD